MTDVETNIVGICTEMCPMEEILFREKHNLLAQFETGAKIGRTKRSKWKADPLKCVKEFRRSAAGEDISSPKCLRVPDALLRTTEYLLRDILPIKAQFPPIYDFVFDRLRSVRQDASIQQIHQTHSITYTKILMNCVKFYMYANYKMSREKITSIDSHINNVHLKETMNLLFMHCCQNDQLFETLPVALEAAICYLLYDLESTDSLNNVLLNISPNIRAQESLHIALQLKISIMNLQLFTANKCIRKLLKISSTSVTLFLSSMIGYFRKLLLKIYSTSHSSKAGKFPVPLLGYLLIMENDEETISLCKSYNIKVVENNVIFLKTDTDINLFNRNYADINNFLSDDIVNCLL